MRSSASQQYMSRESGYPRYRYNGNAFGGFAMTDSLYPRKSNLSDRKHQVLKIAAENFQMVKRLQRVQSSVGRYSNSPASDSKFRSRPKSSLALRYPNVMDPKAQQRNRAGQQRGQRNTGLSASKTQATLEPLNPHAATSSALQDMISSQSTAMHKKVQTKPHRQQVVPIELNITITNSTKI